MPDEPGPHTFRSRPFAAALCLPALLFCATLAAQSANPAANPPANRAATQPATQPAAPAAATPNTAAAPQPAASADPIAIVPLADAKSGAGATVTGALEVTSGKAIIAASGTVTSGTQTTSVLLPRRGTLQVCAGTSVKLAADTSVPAGGGQPGLLMALDQGALEASFATGRNADILLTPDFRILISGPGSADLKIRLGEHGDTCVDNPLVQGSAPYVLVTSVFDGSVYRVQPGQRVMFQHGSTHEVVDNEKEPCGCPAPVHTGTNEFPLAQSAGLEPLAKPAPLPAVPAGQKAAVTAPLVYESPAAAPAPEPAVTAPSAPAAASSPAEAAPHAAKPKPHPGFFHRIGRFFKRIFGAE
ncbi:MAG TPA: hypothetical protein VND90_02560 [Terracidiphilus sp.]|nr:hypothetical protein [Terracidiphilus sp.]